MNQEPIQVALRTDFGKSAAIKLRKQGLIPAVIYGLNEPTVSIAISPKTVARILASDTGMNSLIFLQREGTDIKRHVIIHEVQRDPVTRRLAHVDFMRVDPSRKVRVKVPIILTGTAVGVKGEGGHLDFIHREIEVACLPTDIPAHVEVAVDDLHLGDGVRMDQIVLDAKLELVSDPHDVVCMVHGKKADAEETPAESAEPEVVGTKGKKDEK